MNDQPDKLLLTSKEAAHLLSVSTKTLDAWRANGKGPPFVRLAEGSGRGVRYKFEELRKWVDEHE